MPRFADFCYAATGHLPYGYQERLARDGLPPVVQAPTGAGKTGIVLAWLWRRLHGPDSAATPRRLIYALPQRSLVEQVADEAAGWLQRLGLADQVARHVVMGGEGASQRQWRVDMHRPAIVIGTVDSLVSKGLNRGYGIGRASYPIDFALVTNGAHWVIDECQLCPASTITLRQLAAFARALGTAEPFGLTCMSATVPAELDKVDNPAPGAAGRLQIEPGERTGQLAVRLGARRTVHQLAAAAGGYPDIAAAAAGLHRPGTLTLVVLNTVKAAQAVFVAMRGEAVPCTLLHSRFRAVERAELIKKVIAEPGQAGHIVVATQVVEAGLDLNAALLITEAAPWPSVVQRAGRCNRTGTIDNARLCWVAPQTHLPYPAEDVAATTAELAALEGEEVTGEDLLARSVRTTSPAISVLRRPELAGLFDTAADLTGDDLNIAGYLGDADDLDVQLAWATWEPDPGVPDGPPPADAMAPNAQWRCQVPLGELAALTERDVPVWRLDQVHAGWTRVSRRQRARPGEVLLVAAKDGGYDLSTGFDPAVRVPVPGCPVLAPQANPATGTEDAHRDDSVGVGQLDGWVSLEQHSTDTRAQAKALLKVLAPAISGATANAAVVAAYAHDVGKCHKIWQDALCDLAPDERRAEIGAGRPWAKSGQTGRLNFAGGVRFRHELASLLMLDGPLRGLLTGIADADLARYLVLAHHGKLRVQVREPDDNRRGVLLGLEQDATQSVPPLLGQPGGELTVDLDQFTFDGQRSWTHAALALRDRYGPFVLAYLEAVVRIADWRASGAMEIPQ